ncbi:hypothetical protein [Paracoccus sp. TOH]|uniref:hypothetical protein n=1 Tax=Paracoccus sp. TOH TaxID=1263728 RepID=UPI0025B1B691|nr:hypothetical protein [Paracoccus sp. TOH]WJS85464.1 hypothetical protein NBE95_14970 [Paracoccus sp. TOH]
MKDKEFLSSYNNNLISGLTHNITKTAKLCYFLMALLIPALVIRQEQAETSLILFLLSLIGAFGVVILTWVIYGLEKKRAPQH